MSKSVQHPTIPVKRKVGNKTYVLEGTYPGKFTVFSEEWEKMQHLKKAGYEVKYEEKEQGIGKRKPVIVTLLWVRKVK